MSLVVNLTASLLKELIAKDAMSLQIVHHLEVCQVINRMDNKVLPDFTATDSDWNSNHVSRNGLRCSGTNINPALTGFL